MDPFLGEVRMFGGNFAPVGWVLCDGRLLSIAENDALYTLLGTTYGGDGQSTFGVPDLRGRSPIHMGQGPGLSNRTLGEMPGSEAVSLTVAQLPAHTHSLQASSATVATQGTAQNNLWATNSAGALCYANAPSPGGAMSAASIATAGTSLPHENMMPFQAVNFIMATAGIYPTQS